MQNDGKILILGASSYVGRHLFARLGLDKAMATYCNTPLKHGVRFDSLTMHITDLVKTFGSVTHAVILLGDTRPDSCFADPAKSHGLNVDSTTAVIDELLELGITPVFTSSEFVFDGKRGGYTETDPPNPILLYGRQKLEVERHLEASKADFAILRLAKVYGLAPGDGTFFTGLLEAVRTRESIRCAADQRFSPIFVGDVVESILGVIDRALTGTFHAAGPAGMSRLEFLEMMVAETRRHRPVDISIEPCGIDDFSLPEDRPHDVTMRPDKLVAATGIELMRPEDACRTICEAALVAAH